MTAFAAGAGEWQKRGKNRNENENKCVNTYISMVINTEGVLQKIISAEDVRIRIGPTGLAFCW